MRIVELNHLDLVFMYTSAQLIERLHPLFVQPCVGLEPRGLYEPIDYVLSLGGKRVRPLLMAMTYNMYKEDVEAVYGPAKAIEVYHNHTLLHDDVMDRAEVRRGKPTVHRVWNDNTAILSGDAMLIQAYMYLVNCAPRHLKTVIDLFSRTALEICEGQQLDLELETRMDAREENYLTMIRLKTAVLLAASLKMGAVLADAPAEDAARLYRLGECVGTGFQLQDDMLDVYGDPKVFGKKIGGDILCNKKTFMLIKALELADGSRRKELESWLQAVNPSPEEKIHAVTTLYNELGVRELCEERMRTCYQEGLACLDAIGLPAERKEVLGDFLQSLMVRTL